MLSLESPHRGDSNKYTQHNIVNIKKNITQNHPKSAAIGFFPRDSRRVRNSRGKRAISVRDTEALLYLSGSLQTQIMVYRRPKHLRVDLVREKQNSEPRANGPNY